LGKVNKLKNKEKTLAMKKTHTKLKESWLAKTSVKIDVRNEKYLEGFENRLFNDCLTLGWLRNWPGKLQ
jgi:hypothetical protein